MVSLVASSRNGIAEGEGEKDIMPIKKTQAERCSIKTSIFTLSHFLHHDASLFLRILSECFIHYRPFEFNTEKERVNSTIITSSNDLLF
jgi:hypothetical protein